MTEDQTAQTCIAEDVSCMHVDTTQAHSLNYAVI